jgi:hypothetical protein
MSQLTIAQALEDALTGERSFVAEKWISTLKVIEIPATAPEAAACHTRLVKIVEELAARTFNARAVKDGIPSYTGEVPQEFGDYFADIKSTIATLGAAHHGCVMEVARVAKVVALGYQALIAKPGFSDMRKEILSNTIAALLPEEQEAHGQEQGAHGLLTGYALSELETLFNIFPDEHMKTPGYDGAWSIKDHGNQINQLANQLASRAWQTCFELLPPVGKLLYMSILKYVATTEKAPLAAACHGAVSAQSKLASQALHSLAAKTAQFDKDPGQWMIRLATLLHLELGIYRALHHILRLLRAQAEWAEPEWPDFEYSFASVDMSAVIEKQLERGEFIPSNFGTTLPTGAKTPSVLNHGTASTSSSASVSASDGMRFLESQMRNEYSNYRMPLAESAQREWVNWFTTIEHFVNLFPTPHQIVIENLTTGISDDDVRIYGWKTKCEKLVLEGKSWGMAEFLGHVRGQVLSTVTTRQAAWEELQALKGSYTELTDCIALSTKLQKLYRQMYENSSTEVEPVSRLQCIREVHNQITQLHTRGNRSSQVARAWRSFSSYDSTEVFLQYIDQRQHTPASTVEVSDKYLLHICEQLKVAHDMFTQLTASSSASTSSRARGSVNSMNFGRHTNRQSRPNRGSSFAGRGQTRSRSGEGSRDNTRSVRGRTASRGASATRGGGRGGRTPPASVATTTRPTSGSGQVRISMAEVVRKLSTDRPELAPPYLRRLANLPEKSKDECIRLISQGHCMLCQESRHPFKECPLLKEGHPAYEQAQIVKHACFDTRTSLQSA